MTQFTVCTSLYPQSEGNIADYCAALNKAIKGADAALLFALERDYDPSTVIASLHRKDKIHIVKSDALASPAALRQTMLIAAQSLDAEILVFADFDDCIDQTALSNHAEGLADNEISYGDMRLIDHEGKPTGRTFFENAGVPDSVSGPESLQERNFMGFTNTAIRREALSEITIEIPVGIVAADWWLFTSLLHHGATAKQTCTPVVDYRIYDENTLGACEPTSLDALAKQLAIVNIHYANLVKDPRHQKSLDKITRLARVLDSGKVPKERFFAVIDQQPGVWFDDVFRVADALSPISGARQNA